jgi:hypothetical protein
VDRRDIATRHNDLMALRSALIGGA